MLTYEITGDTGAPPLVLLHAIATSAELWAPQMAAWSATHRVVRLDLPGHGASAPLAEGAGYDDYAAAVAETLDALGTSQAAVVGLSFGAMIAQRLAADRPDLVGRLVLANCVAKTPPPVREMWAGRIAAVEADGMAAQVDGTLARWFTPAFRDASPVSVRWIEGLIRATPPEGFVAAGRAIMDLDHLQLLGAVACPTLVLAGRHDQAAPPAAGEAIATAMPNARFEVLEAAHLANVEQPVAFAQAVSRFLAEAA